MKPLLCKQGLAWLLTGGVGLLCLGSLLAEDALPLPQPLPEPTHPADNAATPEKVALGKQLFFDRRLSRDDKLACATCHDPAKGFSNGARIATGIDGKKGRRSVPGLTNVAFGRSFFWDGRARTLEEQALLPIQDPLEMGLGLEALVQKINGVADYRKQFETVFSGPATAARIAQAIAAYERTLVARDTPFDRYLKGDKKALSPSALRGLELFYGQGRCAVCHKGPNLTDEEFHNIGVLDDGPPDKGRRGITGKEADHGKFKTPSLREVGHTAPYMHNGRFKTLLEVVQHYNFGGVTTEANDHRDEQLRVLYLGEQQANDLASFLADGLTTPRK